MVATELCFNEEDALIYEILGSIVKFRVFLRGGKFCEVFRPQLQDILYVRVYYSIPFSMSSWQSALGVFLWWNSFVLFWAALMISMYIRERASASA